MFSKRLIFCSISFLSKFTSVCVSMYFFEISIHSNIFLRLLMFISNLLASLFKVSSDGICLLFSLYSVRIFFIFVLFTLSLFISLYFSFLLKYILLKLNMASVLLLFKLFIIFFCSSKNCLISSVSFEIVFNSSFTMILVY